MSRDRGRQRRKRRTREHVLEDLSENYLEHKVLMCGHILRRPERDYHVPMVNELTVAAIERFRKQSLETIARLTIQGGFSDATSKPK